MTSIYLYAEVLANIQQANLYASLSTHKNEDTKIDISSDRKIVTVRHDGETASIYLPTAISGDAQVTVPINRGKEIALRLGLDELKTLPSRETTAGDDGPWSANDLTPNARIRCRACHTEILTNELPLVYKDLPSDHWAEMMDFWHCHRPQDLDQADATGAHGASEAAATKGYGASSRLKASVGVALVSPVSILLDGQSCKNVKMLNDDISCSQCGALVGTRENLMEGLNLLKANLSIKASSLADWEAFPPEIFISSRFLSLIESSAARKFVVHIDNAARGLLVWLFNPDIHYSTSRRPEPVVRAVKIFYQEIDHPQKLLDEHQASLEELLLPAKAYDSFQKSLKESTGFLPPTARNFKEWTVGLLDRFEPAKENALEYFAGVTEGVVQQRPAG